MKFDEFSKILLKMGYVRMIAKASCRELQWYQSSRPPIRVFAGL